MPDAFRDPGFPARSFPIARSAVGAGVALAMLGAAFAPAALAAESTLEIVYSFTGGADGKFPEEGLIEVGGVLYGTTLNGGNGSDCGTVFGLGKAGSKTFTHAMSSLEGCGPKRLAAGSDGALYGTTELFGGTGSLGTAFRLSTGGSVTRLHGFAATGPANPEAGLLAARSGSLYGTTSSGAAGVSVGSVFRMVPLEDDEVDVQHLHSFTIGQPGHAPTVPLIEDAEEDDVFYGATSSFGGCATGICGTLFRIAADGSYQLLHSFGPNEVAAGPLVHAPDGLLYGVSTLAGAHGLGMVFRIATDGTGYEVVHSFNAIPDSLGAPTGGLTLGGDGNLYGVAQGVYRINTDGELTTLISTSEMVTQLGGGGATVLRGGLLWGSDGALYGTSWAGGSGSCSSGATVIGCGTVFRVVPGDEQPNTPQGPGTPLNPGGGGSGDGGGGGGSMDPLLPLLALGMLRMRRRRT